MGGTGNKVKSWGNKIEKQKEHDEHHNEDHGNKVGRQKGHNEHQDDYLKQQNWKGFVINKLVNKTTFKGEIWNHSMLVEVLWLKQGGFWNCSKREVTQVGWSHLILDYRL